MVASTHKFRCNAELSIISQYADGSDMPMSKFAFGGHLRIICSIIIFDLAEDVTNYLTCPFVDGYLR